ncbi:MAG: dihydroneopterin aldolase [Candidatus Omnitrophica bacterium]|nr:dihydroneopterin aldolase [Candidatus Omnitrophota bacterium]
MSDVVFLEDVILSIRIGCSSQERSERQPVRLNVYMRYDCRSAGLSDKLKDALNYVKAYRILEELSNSREFVLLERFCEVAAAALLELGAESVRIQASKVRCPIPGLQGRVGVEIERSKDDSGK